MLPCQKKPKTKKEKAEAEDLQQEAWENSLQYFLLTRGR